LILRTFRDFFLAPGVPKSRAPFTPPIGELAMRRLLTLGLVALAAVACQPQLGGKKTGVPVAKGNGVLITSDEVKARLDEQSPFIRARYTTLERKKEFLESLINQEVLAAEAERQGLDKDPDVRMTLRKIMVQKLIQKRFQPEPNPGADVPEADVAKYYEEHKAEYVRARKVRVQAIVLAAQAGSPERAKKLALAKKTLQKIKAEEKKNNPLAFNTEVAAVSEDQGTKQVGGDLQFRAHEELEKTYGKPVADAAFALKAGETSGVVEAPAAIFILKFAGEQPEMNRTLEQVKGQIAAKLSRDKKTKEFDEWRKGLREAANVAVDDKALEAVEVAAAPQAGMGHGGMGGPMGGPAPMMVPPAPGAPPPPAPAGPFRK
jgi:peptidyl-prolyl cis-trans isomerase C